MERFDESPIPGLSGVHAAEPLKAAPSAFVDPKSSVVDVLLLQLGTPTAPTAAAVRPYLRQFLMDGRVLEVPAFFRWLLVQGIIVPFRSPKSAAKYRRIWDPQTGSPLLEITRRQTEKLSQTLGSGYRVQFAMRYSEPSTKNVLRNILATGGRRLLVLPMYPQYSATTTASALDALFAALQKERVVPSLRIIKSYHDEPMYLSAVRAGITRTLQSAADAGKRPELFILSFHGIPIDYVKRGDPYMRQSAETAKLIAKEFGWKKGEWKLTFQSRLGRQKWLLPYFDETVKSLGRQGVKTIAVAQPGFTADCLETIDEIGHEGMEDFTAAGGETLIRVPCLNDSPEFIDALAGMVRREASNWR